MSKSSGYGQAVVLVAAVAAVIVGWPGAAVAQDNFAVDPAHTSATFKIEHMGISWVAGRFNEIAGKCAIDKADPAKCSFEMTIKATSIDTNNAKRDEHLRTADFFDAKQFPDMTFKSTSVKKPPVPMIDLGLQKSSTVQQPLTTQPSKDGTDAAKPPADAAYEVTGDFTMHGVTKPVTFTLRGGKEAELPKGTQRVGFFADFVLKRSDFGMDKMPGGVGDEVKISVSFEAVKQ